MAFELGILLAVVAMIGWGFGDFFIQRSVRKIGDLEALFLICSFGALVLLPFVAPELPSLVHQDLKSILILLGACVLIFVAALVDFQALKTGKLAVVEPIWSLEIVAAAVLSFFILSESLTMLQYTLSGALICGLVLVSLKSYALDKKIWLEKAVFIAILGATLMGVSNFFIGWGARETTVLLVSWVTDVFMVIGCLVLMIKDGSIKKIYSSAKRNKGAILGMCVFDNAAWIAFAYAMVLSPITIAVALSESYILIAVLLGMFVNKEKLRVHQKIGLILAVIAAIVLASIS